MIFPFTEPTPLNRLLWQAIQAKASGSLTENTVTGNPAAFTTDVAKALTGLTIPFTPIQAGSGDPSPTNVRAISGFTGVNVYHSGEDTSEYDTYAVTFPSGQTIYGGTLDAVTGVLTVNRAAYTEDGTTADRWNLSASSGYNRFYIAYSVLGEKPKYDSTANLLVNYMKSSGGAAAAWSAFIGSTGNFLCYVPQDVIADKDAWAAYVTEHPLQIVYELDEPFTIQLDPVTIQTLIGNNTVWTDTNGTNTVKYLSKG